VTTKTPNVTRKPCGCRNIPQRAEAAAARPSDPNGVFNHRIYGVIPGK
jgi:hypothetical protein